MKQLRWAFALAFLLFGVGVTLFFALAYPHHLHFQEQYQLFLFEQSYICEVLSIPGGLADLIGRFLTQFFLYAWSGATIIALVLLGIQLLSYLLLRTSRYEILPFALSFIPSCICVCFLCDENALMSAPVALLIVLGMALLIGRIKSENVRKAVMVVSVPVTYMLAGAFALPYAVILIIGELKKERSFRVFSISCIIALIALTSPLAWHHLVNYPLQSLFAGPHYYRTPDTVPNWAWAAVCVVPLLKLLPIRLMQWAPRRAVMFFLMLWAMLMIIGGYTVNSLQSQKQEDTMAYDFMARNAMWNRIIQRAQHKAPRNQVSVVALNLALAERNLLLDHMFKFPQNGIAGLLPGFSSDYVSPLATAEVLYRLGFINTAQNYVFEAQEAIPDYQKSARCYKRLAETNLINGAYEVSRKYLNALQHTLFYRDWATETLKLIENDEAVNAHPEYGSLRKMRSKENYFFGGNTLQLILSRQIDANPDNRLAYEYLEALYMLLNNSR